MGSIDTVQNEKANYSDSEIDDTSKPDQQKLKETSNTLSSSSSAENEDDTSFVVSEAIENIWKMRNNPNDATEQKEDRSPPADDLEETTSVAAEEEEYELDDDEVDKSIEKDDNNSSKMNKTKESDKSSKRGRWSIERKQVLLEGYVTIRPFNARYGQVKGKWQELADLVNSHDKDVLGTLRARSCKDMVEKLIDLYKNLYSEEYLENADEKTLFNNGLEEAAYNAIKIMRLDWASSGKSKEEDVIDENTFPISVQTHGQKRTIDEISAEEEKEEKKEKDEVEKHEEEQKGLQTEEANTQEQYIEPDPEPQTQAQTQAQAQAQPHVDQEQVDAPSTNPLEYLKYLENLKYLPAIATALSTIAANYKK